MHTCTHAHANSHPPSSHITSLLNCSKDAPQRCTSFNLALKIVLKQRQGCTSCFTCFHNIIVLSCWPHRCVWGLTANCVSLKNKLHQIQTMPEMFPIASTFNAALNSTHWTMRSINTWIHAHVIPLSVQTTIKSHYEGVVALEEAMLTSQTAKGGSCTQGKDNRGRYNHYLHRATSTSLQQGQGVGNLHLNRTDCRRGVPGVSAP